MTQDSFVLFRYAATVTRVVDGDTIDATVDLGFSTSSHQRFRILGIQCPETRTRDLEEKARGLAAKAYVEALLLVHRSVVVHSRKRDSFGRWLADVYYLTSGPDAHWQSLAEELLATGHAVPYVR